MVSYDVLLVMLKIEASTQGTNSMPFLVFRRGSLALRIGDHLWFGIICGPTSGFAVWGSFAVGDHLQRCTSDGRRLFKSSEFLTEQQITKRNKVKLCLVEK